MSTPDPWICMFPVSADAWEEVRHVPASIDEYGEKPEHWVIVARALPVRPENATRPAPIPQGDQGGGASAPRGGEARS